MRYALFSDIHNDAPALEAVLAHARQQGVDAFICLGDVGVDDCASLARQVSMAAVFGNWEAAHWRQLSGDNRRWTLSLPPVVRLSGFWVTHAAPLWPPELASLADLDRSRGQVSLSRLFPYLTHESDALWQTLALLAEAGVPLLFHGHTHRQAVWRFSRDNRLARLGPTAVSLSPGDILVVGVGSVGRPLDGPAPAYAIFDAASGRVDFHRVRHAP